MGVLPPWLTLSTRQAVAVASPLFTRLLLRTSHFARIFLAQQVIKDYGDCICCAKTPVLPLACAVRSTTTIGSTVARFWRHYHAMPYLVVSFLTRLAISVSMHGRPVWEQLHVARACVCQAWRHGPYECEPDTVLNTFLIDMLFCIHAAPPST